MIFQYEIVRSQRKTVSISISPFNEITVYCPRAYSDSKVEKYVSEKSDWIYGKVRQNAINIAKNADIIKFRKIYVGGKVLPLVICGENAVTDEAVYVKDKNQIKTVFIDNFSESLVNAAKELSALTELGAASFSVKGYKGRWGCCDSKKNIVFNYILAMLPYDLQRYVIVHELCHTICFNHSHGFWTLVARFVPDWKNLRAQLKEFNFLIDLYSE